MEELIVTYVGTCLVATLYDVERHVCRELGADQFSDLIVGSICKQSIAIELFKIPATMTRVVGVTQMDVLKYLRNLLFKKRGSRVSSRPSRNSSL